MPLIKIKRVYDPLGMMVKESLLTDYGREESKRMRQKLMNG